MAFQYGYGKLEDELIDLFRSGAPDFDAAEELIKQGANLNAVGNDEDENILSEILMGYWVTEHGGEFHEQCDDCELDDCDSCEYNKIVNPKIGQAMCDVIRYFLNHGFDVSANNGCAGAQCLYALTLSTFDRYMLIATKMLFDAGAINRSISQKADDENETPWDFIGTEGSFQDTCEHDHASGNLYEAVYQVYQAIEDGRPYSGIDTYEAAIGKKITKVLAIKDEDKVFYTLDLPRYKKDNCFNCKLLFVFEGGYLVTTQYADFWVDNIMPVADAVDVSDFFEGAVGRTIQSFEFGHKDIAQGTTHYGQPITKIAMDSGTEVVFSINFGEVDEENRAAFFEIRKI